MEKLFELINSEKEQLSSCRLNKVLTDPSISSSDKLKCIPAISFFVMGFKDVMELIPYENPDTEHKKMVNKHGEEDDFHWEWYLKDLASLDLDIMRQNAPDLLADMFKSEYMPIRNMVYILMRYIKQYDSPIFRIMAIEIVETGYYYFSRDITPVVIETGMYKDLYYFGEIHKDAEEAHEMDVAEEEEDILDLMSGLNDTEKEEVYLMVKDIFENIREMHECFSYAIAP